MNGKQKTWLLREKYNDKETPGFFKDLKRLEAGEPIDYVIGYSDFLGARIDLSLRPLIPRPETEWWVEKAIKTFPKEKISVLDVFSGSGCIGLAILKNVPEASVDFGEKNTELIFQIKKNLEINHIDPKRFNVFESDILRSIPQKPYNFILANPPYIARENIEQVAVSVLKYEPHEALFAEDKGLFFIKQLLDGSFEHLAPGGTLFIEFDTWQKGEIEGLLSDYPFKAEFWKDQYDKWRVAVLTLSAK